MFEKGDSFVTNDQMLKTHVKFFFNVAIAWKAVLNFSEFKSIISFCQQDDVIWSVICQLKPTTFEICASTDEKEECQKKNVDELLRMDNVALFVKLICLLLLKGKENGFENVDIVGEEIESWWYFIIEILSGRIDGFHP